MSLKTPNYSAVYANNPGCVPCQPFHAAAYDSAVTLQMPGGAKADASAAGNPAPAASYAGAAQQVPGIPSAIQQPAIQSAVSGNARPATPATTGQLMPITDQTQPAPMTADSLEFLNGFLRTQIGRRVRVEFLIGTNTFTDKSGMLIGVGANYILLREANSDDILTCDFFNIKFVTIFY